VPHPTVVNAIATISIIQRSHETSFLLFLTLMLSSIPRTSFVRGIAQQKLANAISVVASGQLCDVLGTNCRVKKSAYQCDFFTLISSIIEFSIPISPAPAAVTMDYNIRVFRLCDMVIRLLRTAPNDISLFVATGKVDHLYIRITATGSYRICTCFPEILLT